MSDFGRKTVTIVEIDQDLCENVYGESPCTAQVGVTGIRKCFNTRNTCQDVENYALGEPLTLRFARPDTDVPHDIYIIPSVDSVRTSPTRINVGGRQGQDKPFGRRAQITITFNDHPHSDNIVDPYLEERNYDPLTRSTFWAKWIRRNPFWNKRRIRLIEGYVGQAYEDMQRRHYLIENVAGPDSRGKVTITARDVLTLVDDDKAQAPSLSRGVLRDSINNSETTVFIEGAPISEYTKNGVNAVRVGDEVMRYASITDLGEDGLQLNTVTRGSDNTQAQAHDSGDTVQACLEYVNERPDLAAYDLIVNQAGVDPDFIIQADWAQEAITWLGSIAVTRLLTEPIGINQLLGELCEQTLIYIWWDERTQLINFKAVRPELGQLPMITEDANLIQNKTSLKTKPELRASEIWVSFLPLTPVGSRKSREQYRRTRARISETSASEFEFAERRVYEVFSDWLSTEAQVDLLTFRLLARYRRNLRFMEFEIDAKDRDILDVSQVFDVMYKGFTDDTGQVTPIRYQVISAHESPPGERVIIEAQQFDFDIDGRFGTWMVDDAPGYGDATPSERQAGMWWTNDDGTVGDDENGYTWS